MNPVGMPPAWWALLAAEAALAATALLVGHRRSRGGAVLKGTPKKVVWGLVLAALAFLVPALVWVLVAWEVVP